MATPTGPERRLLAAGYRKAAAWDTALALGAGFGLNCKSISGFIRSQDYLKADEIDLAMVKGGSLDVVKPIEPTVATDMLYDSGALGIAIAQFFGIAGAPAQQGGTTAYKHIIQLADSGWNKFGTMAVELPGQIWECPSIKPIEWSLKSVNGGFVVSEMKLRGNVIKNDSSVNTLTQMDALTYQDRDNRVLFRQQAIRMNTQAGVTLEGTGVIDPTSVEISMKRTGHDSVYPAGQYGIVEPAEGGFPDFRVKLGWPRFDAVNGAHFAAAIAETTQKMTITFTGLLIASTYYYQLKFYFPRLRMMVPEPSFDEIVKNGVELIAEEASAAPTGMSYARPYIEMINLRATDYLA